MADYASVGFWIRRFLSEHLVLERGVSRNTQQSYRDTFCLFLPFVADRHKTVVDKLVIDDVSPKIVSDFLMHLERSRSSSVATRNQRLATVHAFARFTGEYRPEHVEWCRQIRNVPFKRTGRHPVPYMEKDEIDELLRAPIGRADMANGTTPCCYFSTTQEREPRKRPTSPLRTSLGIPPELAL